MKELLRNNAKVEAIDKNGFTPLLWGIFLSLFFISNSSIYSQFKFIACGRGNIEVVKELLRNKASIEATSDAGYTPLIYGKFRNELFISNLYCFFYLLFIACVRGNIEVVKELLKKKANIEAIDKNEFTPLLWGMFPNDLLISNSLI